MLLIGKFSLAWSEAGVFVEKKNSTYLFWNCLDRDIKCKFCIYIFPLLTSICSFVLGRKIAETTKEKSIRWSPDNGREKTNDGAVMGPQWCAGQEAGLPRAGWAG